MSSPTTSNPRDEIAPVLYAEDEADDVFFMRRAFKRVNIDRPLIAVSDGTQAIEYLSAASPCDDRARHPTPSLILLDINLPLRSGFEVLAWIRSQGHLRELPVVMFSSSGRPEDRVRAVELGVTKYVLKPTSGGEFTDVVRSLCEHCLVTRPAP